MSFRPVLPSTGLVGWQFLQRTLPSQRDSFANAPALRRDTSHFEARIGEIDSARDLVADRRLLRVALGAFGLQDDLNNRFFIRKVLEEGTTRDDALANRLTDTRYREMAAAFGFGNNGTPATKSPGFGAEITARYRRQQFQAAVGEQDADMRLAMNAVQELPRIAESGGSETTRWLRIMGNPPLRAVVETALGLPQSFGRLDLDKQVETLRDGARQKLGISELADLADPQVRDGVIRAFWVRKQVEGLQTTTPGSIALSLLQGMSANRAAGA